MMAEEKSLVQNIRSIEKNGHTNQFASVGNAVKEYWRLLSDAKAQAKELQRIMQNVSAGQENVEDLDQATSDLDDKLDPIDEARDNLAAEITKSQKPEVHTHIAGGNESIPTSANWNYHFDPMVWESVSVDEEIVVTGAQLSVTTKYGSPGLSGDVLSELETISLSKDTPIDQVERWGEGQLFIIRIGGDGTKVKKTATITDSVQIKGTALIFPNRESADTVYKKLYELCGKD
jgi:hypothetical protein